MTTDKRNGETERERERESSKVVLTLKTGESFNIKVHIPSVWEE